MKIFISATREQALEAAKTLQREAEQMSTDADETEIHVFGIEVWDTLPEGHLTPRTYPCRHDFRLPRFKVGPNA